MAVFTEHSGLVLPCFFSVTTHWIVFEVCREELHLKLLQLLFLAKPKVRMISSQLDTKGSFLWIIQVAH
jgi:hypothetical protein